MRDRNQLEDLTQEVFIKAFQHLNDFDYEHQFASWLFKITNNHCIDYIRKKRLSVYSIDDQLKTEDGEMGYEIPDSTYEPDLNLLREQKSRLDSPGNRISSQEIPRGHCLEAPGRVEL